jgi:hypothetical protein
MWTSPPKIAEMIPPKGHGSFLRQYVFQAGKITNAPPIYHVMSCLSILSSICCPHSVLYEPDTDSARRDPLHLWLMMLGEPGSRKGHAAKLALKVAHPLIGTRRRRAAGSIQGLERLLLYREHNPVFFLNEAARFFKENRAAWMVGSGPETWCDIFDGEIEARTLSKKHKGDEYAAEDVDGEQADDDAPDLQPEGDRVQVRVNILGTAAARQLVRSLKPQDWEGGLLSRMMFIHAERPKPRAKGGGEWPDDVFALLVRQLEEIQSFSASHREIQMDGGGWAEWEPWFYGVENALLGFRGHVADILIRLTRHVRVLAALIALSCRSATISAPFVRAACRIGDLSRAHVLALPIQARA